MDDLSRAFAALSDPTRRAILKRLAAGEASVTELSEPFQMSMPAVSRHLKVLETAGLISRGRHAQWRPCRIEGARLREISNWLDAYRGLWPGTADPIERAGDVKAAETVRVAAPASGRGAMKGASQQRKKDKKKKEKREDKRKKR